MNWRTPHLLLIAFLILLARPCQAQRDSLWRPGANLKEAFQTDPKLFVGLDTRRSFVDSRDVKIFGIRAGLDFNHRVRIGIGLYGLNSPFYRKFVIDNGSGLDTISAQLDFRYTTYFFEYVFLRKKRWEISFPLHIGWGTTQYAGLPGNSQQPVGLWEANVAGYYKFFWFVGLGAGLGYRSIFAKTNVVRDDFNSLVYNLYIKLFLDEVFNRIFKK